MNDKYCTILMGKIVFLQFKLEMDNKNEEKTQNWTQQSP